MPCFTENDQNFQKIIFYQNFALFLFIFCFYLARHNVGNFALRELIHCVDEDNILNEILESLKPDLIELSCNKFGCFIVQSLINSLPERDFMELRKHFMGHRRLLSTICNSYGSRTMQKLASRMEYKELIGFVKLIKNDLVEITCDQHGTYEGGLKIW